MRCKNQLVGRYKPGCKASFGEMFSKHSYKSDGNSTNIFGAGKMTLRCLFTQTLPLASFNEINELRNRCRNIYHIFY
jgi:hypothetical protein